MTNCKHIGQFSGQQFIALLPFLNSFSTQENKLFEVLISGLLKKSEFTLFLNIHDVNKCYIVKTINTVQWDVAGRVNE